MRDSVSAFVLFQNDGQWLLHWNEGWGGYSLVGGHLEEGESARECATREASEELEVEAATFEVGSDPRATLTFTGYSKSANCDTRYEWTLFDGEFVQEELQLANETVWASADEIDRGMTKSGMAINAQVRKWLAVLDVVDRKAQNASAEDVRFGGRVREQLTPKHRNQLAADLAYIFSRSAGGPASSIDVPRLFSGYEPKFEEKTVMAVEVTRKSSYERHIVKVGISAKVESDFEGWQTCTEDRMVASRMFAPVRKVELAGDRVAVIYRDAFSLFGPDEGERPESRPRLLEDAVSHCIHTDKLDPISAERAISQVLTDLGTWFYRGALPDQKKANEFYRDRLRCAQAPESILGLWDASEARRQLRRQAVWVLCGQDAPGADPKSSPARYIDPLDYVRWVLESQSEVRIPSTLIGRSHGDLHARNILVGIRRGEVQYPAVFDYGEMGDANVLAWDFAKLEVELKSRLLAELVHNPSIAEFLTKESELRKTRGSANPKVESTNSKSADRLAAYLAFEEMLEDCTHKIVDIHSVDHISVQSVKPTGIESLDRLAEIIFRIRQEAAYWLGFKTTQKRQLHWKDEYYFALAVYGLLNVRWDYLQTEQESALVSSGVALARMPSTPRVLQDAIDGGIIEDGIYPSYRVPLAIYHEAWKDGDKKEEKKLTRAAEDSAKLLFKKEINEKGFVNKLEVLDSMQHAVPLIGQALLLQIEADARNNLHAVEILLEEKRAEAATYLDYEMLARVGRIYKDAGDKKWDSQSSDAQGDSSTTRPAYLQMYDKSFEVYSQAYELTDNWYVGINAATLALLTGRNAEAVETAKQVAKVCRDELKEKKRDRFWLHATEGEAAIILHEDNPDAALDFYRSALNELTPGKWKMVDSAYRQVVRLWRFFRNDGERRVGSILTLFESSDARDVLTKGHLGRDW